MNSTGWASQRIILPRASFSLRVSATAFFLDSPETLMASSSRPCNLASNRAERRIRWR